MKVATVVKADEEVKTPAIKCCVLKKGKRTEEFVQFEKKDTHHFLP